MYTSPIRLIAVDLDGTVLNDRKQLTPRTAWVSPLLLRKEVFSPFTCKISSIYDYRRFYGN